MFFDTLDLLGEIKILSAVVFLKPMKSVEAYPETPQTSRIKLQPCVAVPF